VVLRSNAQFKLLDAAIEKLNAGDIEKIDSSQKF